MSKAINLKYSRRPNSFVSVLSAIIGMSNSFNSSELLPEILAEIKGVTIDAKHLNRFNRICEIDNSDLSVIYPFTLVYPLLQRILARKEAPLSMFRVLNTRLQVFQHRKIDMDEILDVCSILTGCCIREKGLEIFIKSVIKSNGEPVWENVQSFYYCGKFGIADTTSIQPSFETVKNAPIIDEWLLPQGIGREFGKISGDGNPIHYSKKWAQMLGFKRDFAQPLLVLANSLSRLPKSNLKDTMNIDAVLKGPVYYDSDVIIEGNTYEKNTRFDIYCGKNPRPCICGEITNVK